MVKKRGALVEEGDEVDEKSSSALGNSTAYYLNSSARAQYLNNSWSLESCIVFNFKCILKI